MDWVREITKGLNCGLSLYKDNQVLVQWNVDIQTQLIHLIKTLTNLDGTLHYHCTK